MKAGTPGQNEAYCFLPTNQEEEKPLSPTEPLCQELTDLAIGLQDAPFILLSSARPRPALQDSVNFIGHFSGASCVPGAEDAKMTKPWPAAWRRSHGETY